MQPFIEAARSVRDLWTGSAILSWLAFQAMKPVIDRLGPTAFVYPLLRGNPLMDLWLHKQASLGHTLLAKPATDIRKCPSLPHRFVAVIPWGPDGTIADQLAMQCEREVREAWAGLAENVRAELEPTLGELCPDWDRLWSLQIEDFFDIKTSLVPEYSPKDDDDKDDKDEKDDKIARLTGGCSFKQAWPDAAAIRLLAAQIPPGDQPGYRQDTSGRWQAQMDFSARVMESNRMIRHVSASQEVTDSAGRTPPKCSLFGSWEQMGPANLNESAKFWDAASEKLIMKGVRLRKHEQFCAVALTKRFAAPAALAKKLELQSDDLRFPDTATVAAADWLQKAGIDPDKVRARHHDWNGRWLHGCGDDDEPVPPGCLAEKIRSAHSNIGKPPSYYAVLKMDGDNIGDWLRGEKALPLKDVLHPGIKRYYQEIGGPEIEAALKARRPLGPALHAAISAALAHFASRSAPAIVKEYNGTVIYSGGDDLLALLPLSRAAACASELKRAYRNGDDKSSGMGERATISAGIVYVHYREDLRLALEAAREAEVEAKKSGRDALHLRFMRRSGEHAGALLPWPKTGWFTGLTDLFARGASNRWAYRLRAELPVLESKFVPDGAVSAEIRRLGNRINDQHWKDFAHPQQPGDLIAAWWSDYRKASGDRKMPTPALEAFVTLCQGAAFVARGRDA